MRLDPPLQKGRLVRRYKRFLADVEVFGGTILTVHCPNTGAMLGCSDPGSEVWISRSDNDKRKYRHTLEVVCTPLGQVGVNTATANRLVEEAILAGGIAPLLGYPELKREAAVPDERGRFDFLLSGGARRRCFVEVKSLTLGFAGGRGAFPDAVSERAIRHVKALARRVGAGERALLLFCVQHTGVERATVADEIHPEYGDALRSAMAQGLEVYAYRCEFAPDLIRLAHAIPVEV
ncbi:MAG: DNA/RNA nuclease SfsA [Pseudomonadales bacterium]